MAKPPPAGKKGLRRQWTDLSLEKKLSIVVVPVALALVGLLVPLFLGGKGGASPRQEDLSVIGEPVVVNASSKALNYGNAAEVQVLVRNTGTVDALIHSAEFRVSKFESAEVCIVPQGELDVSGSYDVVLPGGNPVGETVGVNLAQRVRAGEPDRFSFNIRVADDRPVAGVSRMYVLDILLRHDNAEQPLHVGQVIVALPFPLHDQFVYSDEAFISNLLPDPECPVRNMRRLKMLLTQSANRSADLDRLLTSPRPPDPGSPWWDPAAAKAIFLPPRSHDRDLAKVAASSLLDLMREGRFETACESFLRVSIGALEGATNGCEAHLASLAASVLPSASVPEITETHRGWLKLVTASRGGNRRQLVFIVEKLIVDPSGTPHLEWIVTNVYDAAKGPLDRSQEPVCYPAPC